MRFLNILSLSLVALLWSCAPESNSEISIIPKPNSLVKGNSSYRPGSSVNISISSESLNEEASFLAGNLSERFGLDTEIIPGNDAGGIHLRIDEGIEHPEGYRLVSDNSGVEIVGKTSAGIFYGIQTLLQLLPEEGKAVLPAVEIADEPRFVWRGMHLDVCRHFFGVDSVKRILDGMAMHKLNTFHWHLTEDQGWRIEVEQYPRLAEVAAWRDETLIGHGGRQPFVYDGKKHGGYYTREQINEVVDYAASLHITVVPEIEMPGHSEAAIAAYPELSCIESSDGVSKRWGVFPNVYCAGKESTFEFLENVIDEVIDLFPLEYFHVGGDECPKTHWESCADCQRRIREEGLEDEHELQSYFIQRMEKYLNSKGKKLIGWDEILEGGLAENAAVMSWRGEKGGIDAANMGHYVVMTPGNWCYFDHYQSKHEAEPLAIGGLTPLEEVYGYEPMPELIDPDKRHLILGAQANVWTEYIPTASHAEYMIFPRLCAMAEVQWTQPEAKNYDDFLQRMKPHYARLSAADLNYRVPIPRFPDTLMLSWPQDPVIELANEHPGLKMSYTLDGSDPAENGIVYEGPIEITGKDAVKLRVLTMMPDGRTSAEAKGTVLYSE